MPIFRAAACALAFVIPLPAADTKLVRDTEALTPAEEQTKLHVPPGFEIQLFASEPMINKPINMAFDARGRLWVSSNVEYPYAAKRERWSDDQGTRVKDSRDAIKILEDTDGDGMADKVTDFADGLNIPTGVLPWHKPEHKAGCIAWSIPNIWYFADTDGDDKADVREVLFGPLGYEKDTHGMCSSFRLGLDGWVYATHGFNNTSHIKAKDGSTLELHSGNVFRFKPDGSRVEPWTHGQVNPFGLCWDKYGNLYSADCHSSPIYQLIRGAHYPSFGKPHDGLGFAPAMCQHSHGSTGICGIVYIDGGVWGPEWDDHTFVGNVVTSIVNHDKVTFTGATPKANEQPDFLTSDDPWFRPVDLQLGPDNALYVADFYNKIIGHYEVPLEHPGRDKERGRIWRVVKKGATTTLAEANLEMHASKDLAKALDSPNLTTRSLAVRLLVGRLLTAHNGDDNLLSAHCRTPLQMAHGMWVAHQVSEVTGEDMSFIGNNEDDYVDVHLLRRESEEPPREWKLAVLYTLGCLHPPKDPPVPRTQAAACLALRQCRPDARGLVAGAMLTQLVESAGSDAVLTHMLLRSSKHLLEDAKAFQEVAAIVQKKDATLPADEQEELDEMRRHFLTIAKTIPSEASAMWLLQHLEQQPEKGPALFPHIARYGSQDAVAKAILLAKETSAELPKRVEALQAIHDGLSERGAAANAELLAWAQELAGQLLTSAEKQPAPAWTSRAPADTAPKWALRPRKCADGTEAQVLQSMAQAGAEEKLTGVLRSQAFAAPSKLTFWINGHRGFPNAPAHDKSLVRVVDAKSGEVLASVFPPRSDVCQRVELDLSKHTGKQARLEIVDGDDGKAYAWLGVTRIEPAMVSVDDFQSDDAPRAALKTLATMLQHTAPAALREKLAAYLPPRPAPPPLPVSAEQREQLNTLIAARYTAFEKAQPDLAAGKAAFKTHCATCHQIGGEGGLIGPQLDGIGARGPARLCEDILDPNRNVDAHFHLHVLTLKDGSSVSGFLKAEAGQMLVLADATGREYRVSKMDATKTDITPVSLMPPVFGQLLDEKTFLNLLGYLVNEKPKQ
ncbi:MAG TPA: PVC-type heme-binding CxxCH protein [Prosthecobacter sp.]